MTISEILSILALIISLAGALYSVAYWRGKVDKELKDYSEAKIPDRLTKIESKFELVWAAFTEQVLSDRPHLATHSSPYKLTAQAELATEDVMFCLDNLENHTTTSDKVLVNLPAKLGIDKLKQIATKHQLTLGELLAVISYKLNGC